jgi:YD repeat-containing protein
LRNARLEDLFRSLPIGAEELEVRHLLNGLPVANPDPFYQTALNTQLVVASGSGVLGNDFDAEGSSLTAALVAGPNNGTLNAFNANGSFTYTPNNGFQGIDVFTYQTSDGAGSSAAVRVAIVVGTGFAAAQNPEERIGDNPLRTGALTLDQLLSAGLNLTYRSDGVGLPVVAVDTFLSTGTAIPNSITATLTFGGVSGGAATFNTSGMSTGTTYRFAVQAAAGVSSLATGMYDWTLELVANYSGSTLTRSYSGKQAFVNRAGSEFGAGWWLDGLDRLYVTSAGGLLVQGDGATYWHANNGSGYDRAPGDLTYASLAAISGGYRLTDKWGNQRDFNSSGYLTSFKLKTNNVASFTYSYDGSNRVSQIADEFGRNITFTYDSQSGKLASISDWASTSSTFAFSGANLTAVTAANPSPPISGYTAPQWQYGYTSGKITSVTPPGSSATTFGYDSLGLWTTTTNPGNTSRTLYATA